MNEELLSLLQSVDDPVACEAPAGFDWQAAINRVKALRPRVEAIAGRAFEVDEYVQDASFFTDLATYHAEPHAQGGISKFAILALRFSAFGNLFTSWSVCADSHRLGTDIEQAVIQAAQDAGFVYVDGTGLDEVAYSGPNKHIQGSWWDRYFDYL